MRKSNGYLTVYCKNHPNRDKGGYVRQHRLVMEEHLGRYLKKTEIVHHINGIKIDNRIENLEICSSVANHNKIHKLVVWARNYDFCVKCQSSLIRHWAKGLCKNCYEFNRRNKI